MESKKEGVAANKKRLTQSRLVTLLGIFLVLVLLAYVVFTVIANTKIGEPKHEIIPVYSVEKDAYYFILNGEIIPGRVNTEGGKNSMGISSPDNYHLYFRRTYEDKNGEKVFDSYVVTPKGIKEFDHRGMFSTHIDSNQRMWFISYDGLVLLSRDRTKVEKTIELTMSKRYIYKDYLVYATENKKSGSMNADSYNVHVFNFITEETVTLTQNSVKAFDIHDGFTSFDEGIITYFDAQINSTVYYTPESGKKAVIPANNLSVGCVSVNGKYTAVNTWDNKHYKLYVHDGENVSLFCEGVRAFAINDTGDAIYGRRGSDDAIVKVEAGGNTTVIFEGTSSVIFSDNMSDMLIISNGEAYIYHGEGTAKKIGSVPKEEHNACSSLTESETTLKGHLFAYNDALFHINDNYELVCLSENAYIYNTAKTIDHGDYRYWYPDDYCFYLDKNERKIYRYSTDGGGSAKPYLKLDTDERIPSIYICDNETSIYVKDSDGKLYYSDKNSSYVIDEDVTDVKFGYNTVIYAKYNADNSESDYYHSSKGSKGVLLLEGENAENIQIYDGCFYLYTFDGMTVDDNQRHIYDIYGGSSPKDFKCIIKNVILG